MSATTTITVGSEVVYRGSIPLMYDKAFHVSRIDDTRPDDLRYELVHIRNQGQDAAIAMNNVRGGSLMPTGSIARIPTIPRPISVNPGNPLALASSLH